MVLNKILHIAGSAAGGCYGSSERVGGGGGAAAAAAAAGMATEESQTSRQTVLGSPPIASAELKRVVADRESTGQPKMNVMFTRLPPSDADIAAYSDTIDKMGNFPVNLESIDLTGVVKSNGTYKIRAFVFFSQVVDWSKTSPFVRF